MISDKVQKLIDEIKSHPEGCKLNPFRSELLVLVSDIETKDKIIKNMCDDWADTDSHVRLVAKRFLPEEKVDGNSWHVPCIEELVDMLAELIPIK